MKTVTNNFKNEITTIGREYKNKVDIFENIYLTTQDDQLILTQNDMKLIVGVSDTIEKTLEDDMLFNVGVVRKGEILSTMMKELDFESYENIRVGNVVNYSFGLKIKDYVQTTDATYQSETNYYDLVDDIYVLLIEGEDYEIGDAITGTIYVYDESYEWLDYGKYVIYSKEFNEDTKTYNYVCYDNMLKSMITIDEETPIQNVTIKNAINNMAKRFKYNIKEKSKNMLNVQEGFELGYINGSGTFVAENQTALFNQYIPVEISTKYTISANTRVQNMNIVYYDSNKTFISRTGTQTQISSRTITTPANAVYIRFQFSYNGSSTVTQQIIDNLELQAELGEERTTYEEYFNINEEYPNLTKTINENAFTGANVTYRDVLDMICQAIGTTLILDNNNLLFKKLDTDAVDTIGKKFLKDTNVRFGKKYGPINRLILSKNDEADIKTEDTTSIKNNGVTSFKIKDNLILQFDDRSSYLDGIFNNIKGTEFYLNDMSSIGIMYLEPMDYYNIEVDDNNYKCLMLSDEIKIKAGITESIYTEQPSETDDDFATSTKTNKEITSQINQQNETINSKVNSNEVIFAINNSNETHLIKNERLNTIINNNSSNLKNIESYSSALSKVNATDIYMFNFLNEEDGDKKTVGFIRGNTQYTDDIVNTRDGYTGADLFSMVSVLWQAVKEINTHSGGGTTLYNDTTGSNTTIPLSDNPNNYDYLDITFVTNDRTYRTQRFPQPYGAIELFTIRSSGTGNGNMYIKGSVWNVNADSLTVINHQEATIKNNNSSVVNGNNYITIVKVVGY